MLALEIWINGKRATLAGAKDLCVLNAIVSATGKLGEASGGTEKDKEKANVSLRVGGLTSRPEGQEDEHLTWVNGRRLNIGGEVTVKLVETKRPRKHNKSSSAGMHVKHTQERRMF